MIKNDFKKAGWISNTTVYEVNLRQYTHEGTINAFLPELPRLKAMGVGTLWFMPLTPIAEMNRKGSLGSYYACSDYTAINPEFGTEADFRNLVQVAHEMGFKVLIDWVANHTGWDHVWTKERPDFYKKDEHTGNFKIASGMDDIIELDFGNSDMRKAMIDAMAFWVDQFDIDGFRSDLAFWVTLDFWHEARTALEKKKTLFWLAEADVLEHADYLQVFDAAYAWSWMHKTAAFYRKEIGFTELKNLLQQHEAVCGNQSVTLWFTSNHDENSWNGTEFEKYGEMAPLLSVFSHTWNGIPLLYSGQELPNSKRLAFFEKDVIGWNGSYGLHDFFMALNTLNRENKALFAAEAAVISNLAETGDNNGLLAYQRKLEDHEILVLLNFSTLPVDVDIYLETVSGMYKNIFTHEERSFSTWVKASLPPWGYLVYEKR